MNPRPVLISSWNGKPALALAASLHAAGTPLLDAIVAGIELVEDDPEEISVGYGGLPNEDGVVELDAAVMHGPLHKAGGVAGVRSTRRVSRVALEVLRRTDHALLVGEGADAFARKLGHAPENLLTPKARDAYLAWKASLSPRDAWTADDERSGFGSALWAGAVNSQLGTAPPGPASPRRYPFTWGTIHVSGLDASGDLYSCTSTSGLSYKIAGRVGDSPLVGAGLYTDNAAGSAGCTGRGEATLHNCTAYHVVELMAQGRTPEEACLEALRRIADRTRQPRLLDDRGRPAFNVTLYAVRKDGMTGSASLHQGYEHVVQTGPDTQARPCAFLFPKP